MYSMADNAGRGVGVYDTKTQTTYPCPETQSGVSSSPQTSSNRNIEYRTFCWTPLALTSLEWWLVLDRREVRSRSWLQAQSPEESGKRLEKEEEGGE